VHGRSDTKRNRCRRRGFVVGALWIVASLAACSGTVVSREDVDSTIDLSGYWNDTDSRLVAQEMIQDALTHSWADDFRVRNGRVPAVIVGTVRNDSHEHLNTATFVKDLERAWVDSDRVRVVAAGPQREQLRDEREDQARNASLETAKNMGRELGADFMLQGQINSILDSADGQTVRYYQVELELIDIETNEKAWIGQKKLKKLVKRSRYRW
jgi:uncharacterized protein (TIGR02722 family)